MPLRWSISWATRRTWPRSKLVMRRCRRVLVLDVERQRARDHAADIAEAEAALVLLVAWGLFDDDGIDERDRVLAGHLDEGGGAADADLGGRDADAFAEGVGRLHPAHGGRELGDDSSGVIGFSR